MSVLSGAQGTPTKRCFDCITICNTMHPYNNSARTFLTPLDLKFTTFERELQSIRSKKLQIFSIKS